MRVANVITRLNIGGASAPVISLAVGFRSRGHDSLLIVGTPDPGEGTLEAEAARAGARIVRLPSLCRSPHVGRDALALWRLQAIFADFEPDVVATHTSKAGVIGRLAARWAGTRVVVHTHHGKGFDVFPRGWRRTSVLAIERRLAGLSDHIVVSPRQRDELVDLGVVPARRSRVIRYGIDLKPFVAAPAAGQPLRRELGVPDDALLVAVVGRVVAIKGQDVFLRACARFVGRCPSARVVLVGDGAFRPECERLSRELGLADRVFFLGWRRDIPAIMHSVDVVALPTVREFEGTPVALIEALAAARAVVASDVGGVADLVEHGVTGLLVPAGRPEALAAAIEHLLGHPRARTAMGEAGRCRASEWHSLEHMVNETEQYYRELLEAAD
ncbi:MAG TPA: glycosyltransferase [Vicinamibacterales bacterium]|jgi:glycosyltransferase involved in cell wall biosynthesis